MTLAAICIWLCSVVWWKDWWMTGRESGKKRSWPSWGNNKEFSWQTEETNEKFLSQENSCHIEIWSRHFPNTSPGRNSTSDSLVIPFSVLLAYKIRECDHISTATYRDKGKQSGICMCVCVRTYANTYVCMQIFMYVLCKYICTYVCKYVCIYAYMYIYTYVFMHECMYVCIYVCVYYVCMYVCMYVCAFPWVPTRKYLDSTSVMFIA